MIPKHIVYRIYGDSLAIIMDVPANRVVLLQNDALEAWRRLASGKGASLSGNAWAVREQLAALGIIDSAETDHKIASSADETGQTAYGVREVDLGVVNYWAFKNHIPISGHFELTERCNLRCRHCYGLFRKRRDTLDTDTLCGILDDLQQNGTLGLVLTGGEIFMRRDIIDILNHLSERKFVLRLNTNGTLIDEAVVEQLARFSNVYRIHVSLYSAASDIHDGIVNQRGAFQKTVKALKLLKAAGFNLRINCSVMKSNIDTYQDIQRNIGDPMGIPVHYDSTIFPKDDGGTENMAEQIDDDQLADFWRFKRRSGTGASDEATSTATPEKRQKLCKAAFSFFSICEDGSLYPCLKMKRLCRHPVGNVASESFGDIWKQSAPILNIRKSLDRKLRECDICDLKI